MQDTFKTIEYESYGEFRDRGSKFQAYVASVESEEAFAAFLERVKKLHPKARHACYAYRFGLDKNNFRANDDGEPSGTAGRPILGQIDSFELTNVGAIVIRYFGGTLLGTSGLINAYRAATAAAFAESKIIQKTVCDIYRLHFDYAIMSQVMNATKKLNLEMVAQNFDANPSLDIAIPQSKTEETLPQLKAKIAQVPIEMALEMKTVEGLKMELLRVR